MVLLESKSLLDFPSGFKCTWYGLPHPVQFAVLILALRSARAPQMPALLYGVNRLFDTLEKASHNYLCPYTTAAYMDAREGGRPEYVEGTLCQRKLVACANKGNPRAPLPLHHHRLEGKEEVGAPCMLSDAHDVNGSWVLALGRGSKSCPSMPDVHCCVGDERPSSTGWA
ncbi:unnamed protein product [Ectocarpus sp. CCAP 1310/34]|nr:unnamed protein product [Ectocarpus sp. CCAP 1310/34]